MAKSNAKPVIVLNPFFRLLLWINSVIFVVTFLTLILLALFAGDPLTKAQERLLQTAESLCTMTAGAFIGLLGGRAASPDKL